MGLEDGQGGSPQATGSEGVPGAGADNPGAGASAPQGTATDGEGLEFTLGDEPGGGGDDSGNDGAGDNAGGEAKAFADMLPEEYKDNETLSRFKTFDEFLKSHLELRSKQGDMVTVPGEDAQPEDVEKFWQKLGKPAEKEGYELSKELPEGVELNEDLYNEFTDVIYQNNLTKQQAQSLYDWWNNKSATMHQEFYAAQEAEAQRTKADAVANLKKEWGTDFQKNAEIAKETAKKFLSSETRAYLDQSKLGNHPGLVKDFYRISQMISGEVLKGGKDDPYNGATSDSLQSELEATLGNPNYTKDKALQNKARALSQKIANLKANQ